jgi:hypothetical protein
MLKLDHKKLGKKVSAISTMRPFINGHWPKNSLTNEAAAHSPNDGFACVGGMEIQIFDNG